MEAAQHSTQPVDSAPPVVFLRIASRNGMARIGTSWAPAYPARSEAPTTPVVSLSGTTATAAARISWLAAPFGSPEDYLPATLPLGAGAVPTLRRSAPATERCAIVRARIKEPLVSAARGPQARRVRGLFQTERRIQRRWC